MVWRCYSVLYLSTMSEIEYQNRFSGTRSRAVKRRHNIEIEFDLKISFGSAGNSLAFWAAGGLVQNLSSHGALEPKAT